MPSRDESTPSLAMSWYIVFILMFANMISFIDRQILTLLFEPIKADLGLSDTALSLLHGLAFALFYALVGIPLARIADRSNRKWLIAWGMSVWTVMTSACGLAQHYWQLFVFRMGVGVGEATLSPSAFSMIADLFPPKKMALPIGVFSAGITAGMGLALVAGGFLLRIVEAWGPITIPVIGALKPWQTVFMLSGLSSLPVLLLLVLTVPEPKRRMFSPKSEIDKNSVPLKEAFKFLSDNRRVYAALIGGYTLTAIAAYGVASWTPSLFYRQYNLPLADAGMLMGLAVVIGGLAGSLTGGFVSDWLEQRGHQAAKLLVVRGAAVLLVVPSMLAPIAPNVWISAIFIGMIFFAGSCAVGPCGAALQSMTPPRLRAQASAIYLLTISLLGLGLGPTLVALITDYVFRDESALGYSMLIVAGVANIGAVVVLGIAIPPYRKRIEIMHSNVSTEA